MKCLYRKTTSVPRCNKTADYITGGWSYCKVHAELKIKEAIKEKQESDERIKVMEYKWNNDNKSYKIDTSPASAMNFTIGDKPKRRLYNIVLILFVIAAGGLIGLLGYAIYTLK